MSVKQRLGVILAVTVLLVVVMVVGLLKVSEGARFHQLNSLHLKYVFELSDRIADMADGPMPIPRIAETVRNIRRQPIECLNLIGLDDRLVMAWIGTKRAIELCREDITLADQLLVRIEKFKSGEISEPAMRRELIDAARQFTLHSAEFEGPIGRTVDFVVGVASGLVAVLGLLSVMFVLALARGISGTAKEMERTTKALAESEATLLRAKEAAEQANRSKTEFLALMSHELRTPLNSIIGFSEIIDSGVFGPEKNAKYKEYAHHINQSGKHLLGLISDILDVSRIEAGELDFTEEDVDLPKVLSDCKVLVHNWLADADVRLVTEFPGDIPRLRSDQLRLKQVIINLLSNAIKFTPKGGQVTLGAGVTAGGQIRIYVSDTGTGIAVENLELIFEPFWQERDRPDHAHKGVGLGLTLVKALVAMHGGEIKVQSARNVGTEVSILFPAARTIKTSAGDCTNAGC